MSDNVWQCPKCGNTREEGHDILCSYIEYDQPQPIPNDGESMHDRVIRRMEERKRIGKERYGTILQANNGRDYLRDLREELLDALVYLEGLEVEIAQRDARIAELKELLGKEVEQSIKLRWAIMQHREQKADDRCIEDDDRLYESLGDGIKCDRRVGSKEEMLRNCERFIDRRCEGGRWPSYAELEAEVERLKHIIKGKDKAYDLMNKGMESQCDLTDAYKQEIRELKARMKELEGK